MSASPFDSLPLALFAGLGVVCTPFFLLSRNARLKRRLLPWYAVAAGALFHWWVRSHGGPFPWWLTPGTIAILALSVWSIQFCDACGRTVPPSERPFTRVRDCPACGHDLSKRPVGDARRDRLGS